MSYRTYIETEDGKEFQIFGNDECYPEWIDFIKSQGIEIDAESNYDGYITDIMGAIMAIEKVIERKELEHRKMAEEFDKSEYSAEEIEYFKERGMIPTSLFDSSHIFTRYMEEKETFPEKFRLSITDEIFNMVENGYVFMSYQFIQICGNRIEKDKRISGHLNCFKLKDSCKIHVSAN